MNQKGIGCSILIMFAILASMSGAAPIHGDPQTAHARPYPPTTRPPENARPAPAPPVSPESVKAEPIPPIEFTESRNANTGLLGGVIVMLGGVFLLLRRAD